MSLCMGCGHSYWSGREASAVDQLYIGPPQAGGHKDQAEASRALLADFIKGMSALGLDLGEQLAHVEAMLPTPPKQEQVEALLWKKLGTARAHSIEMEKQATKAKKEVARLQILLQEAQDEQERTAMDLDQSYLEITKAEQAYKAHKEEAKKALSQQDETTPPGTGPQNTGFSVEELDEDKALEEEERKLERLLQEKRQERQELQEQRKKRRCDAGKDHHEQDEDIHMEGKNPGEQAAQQAKRAADKAAQVAKEAAQQAATSSHQKARSRSRGKEKSEG